MNNVRSPAPAGNFFTNMNGNIRKNNSFVNAVNNVKNSVVNVANVATNVATNVVNSAQSNTLNIMKKGPSISQIIWIVVAMVLIGFMTMFWKQIRDGFSVMYESIRQFLGAAKAPIQKPSEEEENEPVTKDPIPPQEEQHRVNEKALVEKILPGRQEVYNVSKNAYTYYDAEPLCKALGSDLATYEQVKQAYAGGAEWCNYGWVKGQMAVYPTQSNTWEQLQQGPEEQRGTCGQPGLNGGFFDNPELKFGVNCYGIKPNQKEHDATAVASGEGAPLSPGGLEFEKKIQKYRGEANSISILPYSKTSWSA